MGEGRVGEGCEVVVDDMMLVEAARVGIFGKGWLEDGAVCTAESLCHEVYGFRGSCGGQHL